MGNETIHDQKAQRSNTRQKKAILFLLCGLPGLYLFVVGSFGLAWVFVDVNAEVSNPPLAISGLVGAVVVGLLLMLVGVGKWGQWRYVLVFLAIPVAFFGTCQFFPGKDILSPAIIVAVAAFIALYLVRLSYRQSE